MNKEQTITGVIRGTGACVPERVLDNNEIAGFVDTLSLIHISEPTRL